MDSTTSSTAGPKSGAMEESGALVLAWVLPVLFFLVLWIVLMICCCFCEERCKPVREKIGLERKFRKLTRKKEKTITSTTTNRVIVTPTEVPTSYKALSAMRPNRQAMLTTYRNTVVDNMKTPVTVASCLAEEGVISSSTFDSIKSQPTPEDQSRKLLDTLPSCGDVSFDSLCASLREQEQVHWLADTLEGEGMSVDKKRRLANHRSLLINKMDPEVIVAHFSNNGVFTRHMVNCCLNTSSREEKNKRILHLLPSRSDRDFNLFCTALRTDHQSAYLADLLEGEGIDLNRRIIAEESATIPSVVKAESVVKTNSSAAPIEESRISDMEITPKVQADEVQAKGPVGQTGFLTSVSSAMVPANMPVILEVTGEVDSARWKYNGEDVNRRPGFRSTSDGFLHELHIDHMTPDLEGTYTCQGYTPDGGAVSCQINVKTIQ